MIAYPGSYTKNPAVINLQTNYGQTCFDWGRQYDHAVHGQKGFNGVAIAVKLPASVTSDRVTRRVDEQFERGLLDEMRGLLARGVPETARPFGGLVYRQALEHLHGVRDEASTRALISQENRRYARRQLIWFRKEPNLTWFDGPGESPSTIASVLDFLVSRL